MASCEPKPLTSTVYLPRTSRSLAVVMITLVPSVLMFLTSTALPSASVTETLPSSSSEVTFLDSLAVSLLTSEISTDFMDAPNDGREEYTVASPPISHTSADAVPSDSLNTKAFDGIL